MTATSVQAQVDVEGALCHCGCGGSTTVAKRNYLSRGIVKGQHFRFIAGHHPRRARVSWSTEDRGHGSPCWIWDGVRTPNGYGTLGHNGKRVYAHRFVFELLGYGPIPDGLHLDHLCRVRECVNPEHLEPVTSTENVRRGARDRMDEQVAYIRRSLREFDRGAAA